MICLTKYKSTWKPDKTQVRRFNFSKKTSMVDWSGYEDDGWSVKVFSSQSLTDTNIRVDHPFQRAIVVAIKEPIFI